MRMTTHLLTALLGAVLAVGCGGGGGSSDGGGSGGTTNDGGNAGSGGDPNAGGNGGNGGTTGGSGGGGDGGSSGSSTVTVNGVVVVVEGDQETPIEGATVQVYGTSLSTTSDESGDFTLDEVPTGDLFFAVSKDGYWGTIDYYGVPGETSAGIQLGLGSEEEIAALGEVLDRSIDEADAVVDVQWDGASGGESAELDADADDPFTFDEDEIPVMQDGVLADANGYADQVFTGVDPDDSPISVTVSGTDGETDCSLDASPGTTFPVVAKSISFVYAICEPAR